MNKLAFSKKLLSNVSPQKPANPCCDKIQLDALGYFYTDGTNSTKVSLKSVSPVNYLTA